MEGRSPSTPSDQRERESNQPRGSANRESSLSTDQREREPNQPRGAANPERPAALGLSTDEIL